MQPNNIHASSVIVWLDTTFPPWVTGIVIVGGGALVTWIAIGIRHRRRKADQARAHEPDIDNNLAEIFVTIVTAMYGVLLAFMIFIVWTNLERADQAATDQGGTLAILARHTLTLPQPARRELQGALRSYTQSVIRDEWPTMAHSQSSPVTSRLFNNLFVVANRLPAGHASSAIDTELDNLSEQRTNLLLASGAALPDIFWISLILGAIISIALSVVFFTETPRAHELMAVAAAILFLGSLWLILEVDYPLNGIAVKPDAFSLALHILDGLPKTGL